MSGGNIESIQALWNTLDSGNLSQLQVLYAPDVQFEDPISKGKGIGELKAHFEKLFRNFSGVSYVYGRSLQVESDVIIEWTLKATLRHDKGAFELPGISWLKLNPESGKIETSREYYNLRA